MKTSFLLLVGLFTLARYFTWDYLYYYRDCFQRELNLSPEQTRLLSEWYLWPNVVCDVFCGLLVDRCANLRMAAIFSCFLSICGCAVIAISYHNIHSFVLTLLGEIGVTLGYETIFNVQVVIFARNISPGAHLTLFLGLLFGSAQLLIYMGDYIMSALPDFPAPVYLIICNLVSLLICLLTLRYALPSSTTMTTESYRRPRRFLRQFMVLLILILVIWLVNMTSASMYAQTSSLIQQQLRIRLERKEEFDNVISPLFTIAYILAGALLHLLASRILYILQVALLGLAVGNFLLVFSVTSIWLVSVIHVMCSTTIQLAVWTLMFRLVPPDEYGAAAGFLGGITNIAAGARITFHLYMLDQCGILCLGMLNCFFINIGAALGLFLWSTEQSCHGCVLK